MRVILGLPASALLVAAIVVGCKSPDSAPVTVEHTEAPSNAIRGWVETKGAGVAFSLPTELPVVDLTSGDAKKIIEGTKTLYPKSPDADAMFSRGLKSRTTKLMALEKTASTPTYRANFNLSEEPMAKDIDEKKLLVADIDQFKKVPGLAMTTSLIIPFPAGKAVWIEAEVSAAGRKVELCFYTLLHNGTAYEFSFSSGPMDKDKWRDIAQKCMGTVRFTD